MDPMTNESLALFTALARDAGNWNGMPLFEGGQKEKGNLTDLKRKGLIETHTDEGCTFVIFTQKAVIRARLHGIDLSPWVR